MLRSLLVGVFALSTASACKGTGDAPAAQPGVAVGKVLELRGDVSATRGTAKRALATGQEISGDDIIETGADARVRIVFAHNNATWDLGPNRKQIVSDSLAWNAPKHAGPAEAVNEATLAAGRHAERETVTTGTTAPDPAPAPEVAPAGSVDKSAPPKTRKEGGAPVAGGGGGGGVTDNFAADEKPAPPKPMRRHAESAPMGDTGSPPSPPPSPPSLPPAQADEDTNTVIRNRVAEDRATWIECMETDALVIEVVVVRGAVRLVVPPGTPETVKKCFEQASLKIAFPTSYTAKAKIKLTK